jgi:hypothetical protein
MQLFTIFAVLVGGGSLLWGHHDSLGSKIRTDGRQLVIETKDRVVRFSRAGSLSETFLIVGGGKTENELKGFSLAVIPIHHARTLKRKYPDFRKCSSPGKHLATKYTKDLSLIPKTRETRRVLTSLMESVFSRSRGRGDVCVRVLADRLKLHSAQSKEHGRDIKSFYKREHFYLAKSVRRVDCRALLR